MARHPVACAFVAVEIGIALVAEDVLEKSAVGAQPPGHALEEPCPVPHVLEHLHRHHTVEFSIGAEVVHVCGDDLEPFEVFGRALGADKLRLGPGVGYGEHPAVRIVTENPHRERAPAAAQIEHVHAILESDTFAGQLEHLLLGVGEIAGIVAPEAARVLEIRTEHCGEEFGWQLIVLLVGVAGGHGHRLRPHLFRERLGA
jgi:hypothetical protein